LFGTKSAFQLYKKKLKTPFLRVKIHIKQLTLFYNNLNMRKLKKLGLLSKSSQTGGINYFFLNLESRIDSIILRLNIGSKFFVRN